MPSPAKTINYRGGIVSFEIPLHWKEEYEPEGGGTFYEDRPDSGTLRLNVLTFTNKEGCSSEEMLKRQIARGSCEIVECSLPMKHYMVQDKENGEALHFYRWEISVPVPPTEFRIVCFVHTIIAGQENDTRIKEELDWIDKAVRTARFPTAPGISGEYFLVKS